VYTMDTGFISCCNNMTIYR